MHINKTTVYTRPSCHQCNATFRRLDTYGVEYEVVTVDTPEVLEALRELGYMQAPVVIHRPEGAVSVDIHWGGFRPDLIDTYFKPVS